MANASQYGASVGVFGIGLAAYWPQFPGLKERLEGYQREVEGRLAGFGVIQIGRTRGVCDFGTQYAHLFARQIHDPHPLCTSA